MLAVVAARNPADPVIAPRPDSNVAAMSQDNPDPQVVPYLLYADANAAMDWLIKVSGRTVHAAIPSTTPKAIAGTSASPSRADLS